MSESRNDRSTDSMTRAGIQRTRWFKWLLFAAFWTLLGLSFASQFYISSSKLNRPVAWSYALNHSLLDWYVFAALSLPAIHLARRFRLERGLWEQSLPIHFGGSIGFSLLYVVLRAWIAQGQAFWAGQSLSFSDAFQPLVVKVFHFSFLVYWVIIGVSHAFDYYRQAQDREFRGVQLERRLTEARLQALQIQLNPHFLFNTLHAISALMHQDVNAADRMIVRLSDLLRYALESTDAQEVPLGQELDFLDRYLEIEQTRFGPRLAIHKQIDPFTLDAAVPNLILQPLLENAIQHGIEPHARPGRIDLSIRRQNGTLEIQVRDNGDGFLEEGRPREGVGLSNTRARLDQLYGAQHRFEFGNATEGAGFVVRVVIPFRLRKEAATGPAAGLAVTT
ncbi:MAG: sensor histidine kinase [Verrucomicrobiales bacterium]|nr:sensor histidine kinase [Verrucomicrobiales bacterium]